MVLTAPVADVPSFSTVVSPPHRPASSGHQSLIAMLLDSGQVSAREAAFLEETPCALDDIVLLAMLHQRHDLTDLEYEFEKGEVLRQARRFVS